MTEQFQPLTREEQAKLEIGHTEFRPGAKGTLFVVGLLTLFSVPVWQTYHELRLRTEGRRETVWPRWCDVFVVLPRAAVSHNEHNGGWMSKTFRANAALLRAIDTFEKDLQDESFLTQFVLPPTQALLVHAGSGNEKGYVGRGRWLFYRPGIDYCAGPGFLDPRHMARRTENGTPWRPAPQPDPRVAILQFHRQLAERDIRLVIMPTPDKATIHPEQFSGRYRGRRITVHNASYQSFIAELETAGVLVCDVTDALARYRDRSRTAAYLATDTHWRPEAMELAARELARFIEENVALNATAVNHDWRRTSRDVANLGDIALMLKLPPHQRIFAEERVTIHPVTDAAGEPWQSDPAAEILMLGDSFANIYSLNMMNWGSGAGLAEQLSRALNRPVDAMLRNDDGAYATRAMLSRELAQGEDRLAGKKVVVWQFAARELAVGDWKRLDMTLGASQRSAEPPPPADHDHELIISGTIAAKSSAPRAGQIPYAHHIFTLDLHDVEVHSGTLNEPRVAVYLFSMRDYQNTPAFSWPVGKRVTIRLQPWRPRFFARYGRINRTETDDIQLERPWWGEVIE